MSYLSKSDYTITTAITHLDEILTQAVESSGLTEDQCRQNAEATAQALIVGKLTALFNINAEMAKASSDTTRDRLIILIMVNIALFFIYKTANPRDIPELREKAYDEAISLLKDIWQQTMTTTLTLNAPTLGAERITLYSAKKFISKPFEDAIITTPENPAP